MTVRTGSSAVVFGEVPRVTAHARPSEDIDARLAVGVGAFTICLLPFLTPVFPGNSSPIDFAILATIAAALMWAGSTRVVLRAPYAGSVALIVIGGAVAAMFGEFPVIGIQTIAQDAFLLGWAVSLANMARRPRAIRTLTLAWCYSAELWASLLVVAVATDNAGLAGIDPSGGRAAFTFGNQNTAAAYFTLSLIVVVACRRPRPLGLRVVAITTIVFATLLTGSLAGILGSLLAIGVIAFLFARRRWGIVPATAALAAGILVTATGGWLFQQSDIVERSSTSPYAIVRYSLGRTTESSGGRGTLARETSRIYRSGNLVGIGPAATKSTLQARQASYQKEAHNDAMAALVERGALGIVGVISVFAVAVFFTISIGRGLRSSYDDVLPSAALLIAAIPVIAIFSVTHEILHNRTLWTLLGVVAALAIWGRPDPQPLMPGREAVDDA